MKIATVSLDYYTQNSVSACRKVGQQVENKKIMFAGFTEVRTPEMDSGLRSGLKPSLNYVDGGESPQAFNPTNWELTKKWQKKLTDGEAGVTPNLYAVIGEYQHNSKANRKIAVISTHLVPLTLNGKRRSDFEHRIELWRKHFNGLGVIVQELKAKGLTSFVVGDFNNSAADKNIIQRIDPKAKWIIKKDLDWIFVVEAKTKVLKLGLASDFSSGSDHRAWARTVYLS